MRALAVLAFAAMLSLGCDGSDISDNPPVNSGNNADASTDAPDNGNDAGDDAGGGGDAQAFCDGYETTCMYDDQDANRFDNEQACLDGYNGFDATRRTCVENALEDAEMGNLNSCRAATGLGPCSN